MNFLSYRCRMIIWPRWQNRPPALAGTWNSPPCHGRASAEVERLRPLEGVRIHIHQRPEMPRTMGGSRVRLQKVGEGVFLCRRRRDHQVCGDLARRVGRRRCHRCVRGVRRFYRRCRRPWCSSFLSSLSSTRHVLLVGVSGGGRRVRDRRRSQS